MSKQMPFEDWAPPEWLGLAKGLYAGMLRKAAIIENLKDTPPALPDDTTKQKGVGLFRFRCSSTDPSSNSGSTGPSESPSGPWPTAQSAQLPAECTTGLHHGPCDSSHSVIGFWCSASVTVVSSLRRVRSSTRSPVNLRGCASQQAL